ncbi:hypothetical protein ONS95_012678 [Cadophora gregata]|uniref:uncharacterized protein n=1 Tax=Cadophora gregata TaxID=51156 RepID=UPI0026DB630E|nr:uncharacterized protein ONS95_012678 [Cadophora gregata]KAK0118389.1 hypothetical protein ONS95_012678 [Cadophora gregata]KAK0123458.1 hypothetical protein ONS96_010442 [Cadophora gregata f. sp. sojae]
MEVDEKFKVTGNMQASDYDEAMNLDVDPEMEMDTEEDFTQDRFFPNPGEDETEFGVNWCINGVLAAFAAKEAAQAVISEAIASSSSRSISKPCTSKTNILSHSRDETGKGESKVAGKKTKHSSSHSGGKNKTGVVAEKKTASSKSCSGIRKRSSVVSHSVLRWILPKPKQDPGPVRDRELARGQSIDYVRLVNAVDQVCNGSSGFTCTKSV